MEGDGLVFIKEIKQENSYAFSIIWNDGKKQKFSLCDLQRNCPCQRCQLKTEHESNNKVKAFKISSVGNYALRIYFTSGCSAGIYSFEFLRSIQGASC